MITLSAYPGQTAHASVIVLSFQRTILITLLRSMCPNAQRKLIMLQHIMQTTLSILPMAPFVPIFVSMWNSD